MKINKSSRIFLLALLMTYGSLLWLNVWHEISYQYGVLKLSPFRNLFSDSALVFLPVIAAVWVAASIIQWITDGFDGRMSPKLQTVFSVLIPSLLVSAVLLMVENNRNLHTGIGRDLSLAVSICGSIHADGFSFPWNLIMGEVPSYQSYRVYVLLQDAANLLLANLGIALLFALSIEKVENAWGSFVKSRLSTNAMKPHLNRFFTFLLIFSIAFTGFVQAHAAPFNATDESIVPHYFGPWPNWANSPYTLADAEVVITGNGSGATAEATVGANGEIIAIDVTNGGSGYSNAKINIVSSTGNTSASAKATIVKRGAVTSITLGSFGSGYQAPVVTFAGGGSGSGAAATAYGGVDQVTVTGGGLGYTMPIVDFDLPDGPGGVQAQGHVASTLLDDGFDGMNPDGSIKPNGIIVDSPGSGYSKAPGVAIHNGTLFDPIPMSPGSSAATASSTLSLSSVVLDAPGANYKTAPAVIFGDQDLAGTGVLGSGASAVATIDNGVIASIEVINRGEGYVTDTGIRKFVDGLPLLGPAGENNLGQYMPVAEADTSTFSTAKGYAADSDYYVIALVQHREQMHSDLPATLMREYVQLHLLGEGQTCDSVGGVLLYTDFVDKPTEPTYMPDGTTQACGYDQPHFLGPVIVANKDKAVRITFYNLLPTGGDGDLFMPVDSTFMGSGMGPSSPMMSNEAYDPAPVLGGDVTDPYRNPYCTDRQNNIGKDGTQCFVDNRATLHLHGGITPWISDGTPHQWITPAGENTPWPEGVSVGNVPDMITAESELAGVPNCSDPADGCSTFYYTNQQSARLMFYHDHAWGITRLNVYAGEAAGYLIRDDAEQALIDAGIIPGAIAGEEIPLVIQDRTFVPDDSQLYDVYDPITGERVSYGQDPTWDKARWGGRGSLWYEHVYMPAQNPSDPTGMSAYGRWMYGPWFWPPQDNVKFGPIDNPYFDPSCAIDDPATWQYDTDPFCEPPLIPGTPNNSAGMEQFNDTPIVNGTAYPTITLDPKSYRFRILNAANDRFWNLSWYVADPTTASRALNGMGEVIGGTEVAFNAAELAAAQIDPNIFPTPDTNLSPAGPDWIQIGTEGGFLPAPAVIPAQPTTWIIDPTRFDVGLVDLHSLLVAPAERSDVVVDFSQFAGQTLILYNDAPAAFPARVASYDYYTGAPDLSPAGAPTILPGYGPNTRTIMQVKIRSTAPAPAYDMAALNAAFRHNADGSGVFESSQHPIIVGQAAYNSAYGTSFANAAWCNSPSNPSPKCDGLVRILEQGGDLFKFDTLTGNQISIPLEPKAIHDEMNSATFDEFGRMTANLGVESVPANPGGQNINLMPYVFPPTEVIDATNLPKNTPMTDANGDITMVPVGGIAMADGTQIWKITHNGVDTHPIHFHLYDVQLLNRVTWDNIVKMPDPNEIGWKDTVRISPLEDTIVALRPIIPWLPFEIPNSVRELSPMMPTWNGTMPNIDPLAPEFGTSGPGTIASATLADALLLGIPPSSPQGEPIDIFNHYINFGWEYVFHCHILSHEEMDMMRPVLVALPPKAPTNLALAPNADGDMTLTWTDNSIAETGYLVEKLVNGVWTFAALIDRPLTDAADGLGVKLENTVGGTLSYIDPLFVAGDQYRVLAQNTVGDTWNYATQNNELDPNTFAFPVATALSEWVYLADVSGAPAAPTALEVTGFNASQVNLAWADNASNEDGFTVERSDDGFVTVTAVNVAADVTSFSDTTVAPNSSYQYRVFAFNGTGNSALSNTVDVTTLDVPPAAPTDLVATDNLITTQVDMMWVDNSLNETGFVIERSGDAGTTWSQVGQTDADVAAFSDNTVIPGSSYLYQVYAFNGNGNSSPAVSLQVDVHNVAPADPAALSATATASQVDLNWTDNSNNETSFIIQRSDAGGPYIQIDSVAANVTTFSDTTVVAGTLYSYRVYAINADGVMSAPAETSVTTTTGVPPAAPLNPLVTNRTQTSLTLSWSDNSNNEDGFMVQIATDKNFTNSVQTFNVGPGVTMYQFYPLAPNQKYFIRVAAFNAAGSSWSAAISDKTLR